MELFRILPINIPDHCSDAAAAQDLEVGQSDVADDAFVHEARKHPETVLGGERDAQDATAGSSFAWKVADPHRFPRRSGDRAAREVKFTFARKESLQDLVVEHPT